MGSGSFKFNNGVLQRGRPYGMLLLLAFGAALLGVMALHKLRERRISSLLLKDKDRELFSLHLLLQRERDHNTEMKRKCEGMKEKMYAFRTQKMELDSAVLEMQSTVGSLKDEMRAMELALQEKDSELKTLREKQTEASRKDFEEVSLREILNLKEAEIEDLKLRLEKQKQVNIGSASTNDPLSLPRNSTMQGGEVQKDETSDGGVEEKRKQARELNRTYLIESKNEVLDGEVASRSDKGSEDKLGSADKMEVTEREKLQGKGDGSDGDGSDEHQRQRQVASEGNGIQFRRVNIGGLQGERKSHTGQDTNTPNETSTLHGAGEVPRNRNENGDSETINVKENPEERGVGKGGMKLEISENSRSSESDSVVMGKQGNLHVSRKRGKKWRMLARNRRLENKGNNKIRFTRDAKVVEHYRSEKENQLESTERKQQDGTHSRRDESEQKEDREREKGKDQVKDRSVAASLNEDKVNGVEESDKSKGNINENLNFSAVKLIESENSEDKEDAEETAMNGGERGPVENEQEQMKSGNLLTNGEVLINSASQGEANNVTNEDTAREANVEIRRQEDQGADAVLEIAEVGTGKAGLAGDKEGIPDRIEEPRHSEDEESKADSTGQDFSRKTYNSSLENEGEYKAETDDSEF